METREEQKQKRKQQIIFAALDLFVTKGYAATKITDIAEKANMSVGLLFHYYESKDKLYEALVTIGLQSTKIPFASKYEHAIDYFVQFTTQLFAYMKKEPMTAKFFTLMADAQRSEGTPTNIREIALQVNAVEQSVPIIKRGQKEGSIRKGNVLSLSIAYWCCIQGIAEQYAANPEISLPDPEWIVDVIR